MRVDENATPILVEGLCQARIVPASSVSGSRGMIAISSVVSIFLGTLLACLAERYPHRVVPLETAGGLCLVGGLAVIGGSLPLFR
jgi:hypothetical protein